MRRTHLIAAISLLALLLCSSATASLSQFSGGWKNTDPNTSGITRLEISTSESYISVQAWGKCHPEDCDWGEAEAISYAPSVESDPASEAEALLAIFNPGFAETTLVIQPAGNNRLKVLNFQHFTDGSGRSDYMAEYIFTKSRATLKPPSTGVIGTIDPKKIGNIIGTVAAMTLPAPVQVSPVSGSVSDKYPRTTTLRWKPVEGAASYTVEIDCYHCCQSGAWCTDVGDTWSVVPDITDTSYTFDFVGAQPGRWRVWAVSSSGAEGTKSGWWEFKYTR
ncbi:MAG: hypothetical protein A4E45_00627 [Methanosaeta sp. PtaB.Bin039]|nr:MAG: hypothetical protein A4E45_00627 [Methanosaeta sp. PtaB.Bin039]